MNMRILDVQRKMPCVNLMENMYFDDLMGFVCFIPSVISGDLMMIMYDEKYGKEEILL